ncbi:MAG: uracil-DNA glycosylase family protein [Bacteriovorax sp.]|nr:uracil-DNA glycosylase family protein [Bacteriovorax sp.]
MKSELHKKLISEIKRCNICNDLPLGPKPIFQFHPDAKILIIGQAPGVKAHESGIPWNDASGERLREWMGIEKEIFYNEKLISLLPMGLCYPGKGVKGDLPPRRECFPYWHQRIITRMPLLKLIILVGNYSQSTYLKKEKKKSLTETVRSFHEYIPKFFPLPHPSPLNNIWLSKNRWFENEVLPELKLIICKVLNV